MTTLKVSELIAQLEKYKARVGDLDVFMADAGSERLDGAGQVFVVQSMSGGNDVKAGEGFITIAPSGEYIEVGQKIGAMKFE
jgi:hypothetical protein